ncbi:MAG: tetratricopeptide repeat protein, partial [Acidobacteria bacterium]|nr:tetratricopeptide repeat protein [Acidobacteriota bacterium]MDW7985445.1 tetratricopeptide repeat protein [Acidobacteriota bacterium]
MTVATGWAQPAGPAEVGGLPLPVPFPSLVDLLPAIEQGNTRKVTEVLARVEDFVHRTGTRYMPELAMALWQAGLKAREKGDVLIMDQCSRLALQLDPTNPYFHIALAWYQFHSGPRSWGAALRHTWKGFEALGRRPGGRNAWVHWTAEWLAWLAVILMATLGLLAGLQLGPLFVHDASERWSLRAPPWMAYVLVAATLGFVFPWLGGLWNLWWVGILFIGYMHRRQRIVWLILAGLVISLTSLAYLGQAAYERYERAPRKWILTYYEYGMSPSLMYAMYNALQQTPQDLATLLLYGHGFTRHGYYREAEATYRRALQYFPNHPAVLNNLGNVYFFQENYAQAIEYYRAAEDQPIPDPKLRAYVLYNHG